MSAEELNRSIPLNLSDGFEYCIVLRRIEEYVAGDNEKVDVSVVDGFEEPSLLDGLLDCFDNCIVRVPSEIKEKAKSQDANALVLGGELSKSWS